jgi:hypothetical protein
VFGPPFSGSVVTYVGFALLGVSLLLFSVFIFRRVSQISRRGQRRRARSFHVVSSTIRLLLLLLLAATACSVILFGAFLRSYSAFTHRERVALIHCTPVHNLPDTMDLQFVTFRQEGSAHGRIFRLRGQQWSVEGHVLKWDDWLNFVGLHTMYKLTRVRGRYLRAYDEMTKEVTAYTLVAREEDPYWEWLFRYGAQLPFVTAVYGNTIFTFPSEEATFGIYVTTSGFMIEVEPGERYTTGKRMNSGNLVTFAMTLRNP